MVGRPPHAAVDAPPPASRVGPLGDGLDLNGVDNLIVIAVILGIVLLPVIIVLSVFIFEWLFVLLLLPLATLGSALAGRPWQVVARQGSSAGTQHRTREQRQRYARGVRGWRTSSRTIAQVRRDIAETGAPRSLGEPTPLRRPRPVTVPATQALGQQQPPAVGGRFDEATGSGQH